MDDIPDDFYVRTEHGPVPSSAWTLQTPTVPGWYWFKAEAGRRAEIVRLNTVIKPIVLSLTWDAHVGSERVQVGRALWYGPLEEPK